MRSDSAWPVMVSAVLLSGAVAAAVAAATMRLAVPEAPGIASVRLGEMTAAWTTRAATEGKTAEDVRVWGVALDGTVRALAIRDIALSVPALDAREKLLDELLASACSGSRPAAD